jgi:putative membrane protein
MKQLVDKKWPLYRLLFWFFGVLSMVLALMGPIAEQAHENFIAHMMVHLLLGMVGPLLIVLSAPMTIVLRTLDVHSSRKLTKILKSSFIRFLSDPVIASILNIGGLWILYTTKLFTLMHENFFIYLFIHFHIFLAGYVFTISMIYIDPVFHRKSFTYRAIVLIFAFTGHSILSKYIYAYPPHGISDIEAKKAAMFMYYGGDLVEIAILTTFCWQWYKTTRPKQTSATL